MEFFKKLFNFSFLKKRVSKESGDVTIKGSKIYALERLKEIHNYDYSTFVTKYYSAKNHTVWEYSKEKNLINHSLNLVMKREKDILLIDCISGIHETTLDSLLEFEKIGVEFIAQYKLFKNYNILYLCICSEDRFSDEALEYITSNSHISYEVLKEFEV